MLQSYLEDVLEFLSSCFLLVGWFLSCLVGYSAETVLLLVRVMDGSLLVKTVEEVVLLLPGLNLLEVSLSS